MMQTSNIENRTTKIGYFPGCSLHGMAIQYEESLKAVAMAFDIELVEVKDWNCCGSTPAHSLNHLLSVALPARTLALAEQQGFTELVVPCAACYSRLLNAWNEFKYDEKIRSKIPGIIEMPYIGKIKPINVIEFLEKYILPGLKDKVTKPFTKKVACYYGCLLVRPPKLVHADNYEDPQSMENLMKVLGAKSIDWAFKTECCGAGLSLSRTDIIGKLSGKIVEDANDRGAEAIVVACPMCQSNLDMRRGAIDIYLNKEIKTPVLFITQVVGLALGLEPKKLGIQRHLVSVDDLLLDKAVTTSETKVQKAGKEN